MARYSLAFLSQSGQLSGVPAGLTVNGYLGYLGAGTSAGFRLRELKLGFVSGAGVPVSQNIRVGLFRQTVAPAGTGLAAAIVGVAEETFVPADPTVGFIATTATAIGTTGPTIGATPFDSITVNAQSGWAEPYEFPDDFMVAAGTANGIALVNLAATLNSGVQIVGTIKYEV